MRKILVLLVIVVFVCGCSAEIQKSNSVKPENADKYIEVLEVKNTDNTSELHGPEFQFRVKNISDRYIDQAIIKSFLVDKNGERIADNYFVVEKIKPGYIETEDIFYDEDYPEWSGEIEYELDFIKLGREP